MFSKRLALTVCFALVLAAVAGAQVARDDSRGPSESPRLAAATELDFPACTTMSRTQEPDDPRWRWRLRAYEHLDCVTTIVDNALEQAPTASTSGGPDDENGTVTISRADLERIRTLAWWARDAAARIGQ